MNTNKNKNKISKELRTHDAILYAVTSFKCKDVLTIEEGNFFYWVRQYQHGRLLNNYGYFETLKEAYKKYNEIKNELKKYNVNLKFNEVKL